MASYLCDHDGTTVPADFYLRVIEEDEERQLWAPAYACCREHVLKAVEYLLGDSQHVTVSLHRVKTG